MVVISGCCHDETGATGSNTRTSLVESAAPKLFASSDQDEKEPSSDEALQSSEQEKALKSLSIPSDVTVQSTLSTSEKSSEDSTVKEAALKLGMLTGEEFDTLVVPEKMIGPSD